MAASRMAWLQLIATVLVGMVAAVDRSNFKTCDQSGFCKRHRSLSEGESPYIAQLDTLAIQPTKLTVQLLNTKNNLPLSLEVSGLQGNMVRMRVNEINPLHPRYEIPVGDCLVTEPKEQNIAVNREGDKAVINMQDTRVELLAKPFRLDVYSAGQPVISINSRGLLKFEHYRQKEAAEEKQPEEEGENADEQQGEEAEEEQKEENEPEEPDMWEETFKTHKDTKPRGPSSVGLDISLPGFEFVYGIPEHADTLALKSTKNTDPYRLYNLDVFEYELNNPMALYGSVPLMIAHNEQKTLGVFWMNAAETWVDIGSNVADKGTFSKLVDLVAGDNEIPQVDTHWFSESGIIEVFLLMGPTPEKVFTQYASLTGVTPLPPLFGIAYHQSRWNYNDEQDVANVDAGYDLHDIPMDVIWLDIEHTDGKRYFTWDKSKFPNSIEMINNISAKARKMVTIVDPHMKRDGNYHVHQQAEANGYYVMNKDGNAYDGWCWPGSSGWLDFLNPVIREFWAQKFSLEEYEGSTLDLYTWNDMNEPSVFNGPEITMHKDAQHFGGWEHRDVHNMYGTYVHRSTFEGHLMRSKNERPFVLSRAFFAGSQRWGAVWTGDNTGDWGHLKMSMPMLLSLNLVGITFSGADVGGFFKNPDTELLTRWYQAGAYQPFFRAHAHLDTRRREPWLQPEDHKVAIRAAIRARYQLLPLWYTLFYEAEERGGPVMKPCWVEFPAEKATFAIEDQYFIGRHLLVRPVTDAGATGVNVYFPGQDQVYYDIDTFKSYPGGNQFYIPVDLNKIPVFQRGGFIVSRKERVRRSANLGRYDPYTLVIALNHKGTASGTLYIDDYHTHRYRTGEFAYRSFAFEEGKLKNRNIDMNGEYKTKSWLERVVIIGLQNKPTSIEASSLMFDTKKLEFAYEPSTKVLVIRKPDINIVEDWVISLK